MPGGISGLDKKTQQNLQAYENMSPEQRHESFDEMMDMAQDVNPGKKTAYQKEQERQAQAAAKEAMHGNSCWVPKTDSPFEQLMPRYTDEMTPEQQEFAAKEWQKTKDKMRGLPIPG
jgi:hypothetical protein